jgi:hypothetical protein
VQPRMITSPSAVEKTFVIAGTKIACIRTVKQLSRRSGAILIAVLALAGCSQSPDGNRSSTDRQPDMDQAASARTSPTVFKVVETAETKEHAAIDSQVLALLASKDYRKLDELARQYRESMELGADGIPKLGVIYNTLDLGDDDPEPEWQKRFAALRAWSEAKPDSLTARLGTAGLLVSYAWRARGGGYANTVKEQGWRLFDERLHQAVSVLRDAARLPEKCPRYWSVYLQASLGLGTARPEYDAVFDQAVQANPSYMGHYCKKAVYLLPRWHGKEGETAHFLASSADHLAGDEGDVLYARVVWALHNMHIFDNIFDECHFSWDRVQKGFAVIEKRFPNSIAAKNEEYYLAALAGRTKAARNALDKMDGNIDLSIWHKRESFDSTCAWLAKQK